VTDVTSTGFAEKVVFVLELTVSDTLSFVYSIILPSLLFSTTPTFASDFLTSRILLSYSLRISSCFLRSSASYFILSCFSLSAASISIYIFFTSSCCFLTSFYFSSSCCSNNFLSSSSCFFLPSTNALGSVFLSLSSNNSTRLSLSLKIFSFYSNCNLRPCNSPSDFLRANL
jgi:hypothetical protein